VSILNISLDFELHWGRFDKVVLDQNGKSYFENTRYAFPKMVDLFLQYDVHVTWAAVGMLYNQNGSEWRANQPKELPTYNDQKYSSYAWVAENGLMEPTDPYHFAPDLISLIENKSGFEIGTHTYSHYYCKEPGQTAEQFKADLTLAKEIAAKRGHQLKSLVFPRNQFNEDYLQVCHELGIEIVRSNPDSWYWDANKPESLAKKVFRTGDAYSNILGPKVFSLDTIDINQKPLCLPASRLYRAWTSKSNLLNKLKLQRILNEMTFAAKTNGYYHLWWHPHNFGWHPDECLKELEQILQHYRSLHQRYGMQSLTMWETKEKLLVARC
jgi:peptidoglycan/xylan/chitin deacetylase (PgdA/CDA1 family)